MSRKASYREAIFMRFMHNFSEIMIDAFSLPFLYIVITWKSSWKFVYIQAINSTKHLSFWRSCELKGIFVMCFSWECKNFLFHSISYFILSFQAMNSTDNIVPVEIEDASIQTFHTFPDGSNIQCFSSIFYSGLWELCWRALAVTQWWTSGPPVKDLDWKMYLTSFSTWLSCLLSLVALCSL